HPEGLKVQGVGNLMNRHGATPSVWGEVAVPCSNMGNKSFSASTQGIDFTGSTKPYLPDPQHLQHRACHERRYWRATPLHPQPPRVVAAGGRKALRRHQFDDLADRVQT